MTHCERFRQLMDFGPVDRLPVIEWAPWWDQTLARWRGEGLPADLDGCVAIQRYFGLDPIWQLRIGHRGPETPVAAHHGAAIVRDEADYERVRPTLFGAGFDRARLKGWAEQQQRGELLIWLTFDGFFWFPRTLLGIEGHLFAFYDQPALMQRMNEDLLAHQQRVLEEVLALCTPDFVTFAEDMSYNHGPMIARERFDEFLRPYYLRIVPRLREAGVRVFIDSDGDVTGLIDWFLGVGAEGFLPLERMAGVDVVDIRRRWPRLLLLGAYDKTVMHRGDEAVRGEFDRLMPAMSSGGFAPSVDHQTPPGVSLEQYRRYVEIYRAYAGRACTGGPTTQEL